MEALSAGFIARVYIGLVDIGSSLNQPFEQAASSSMMELDLYCSATVQTQPIYRQTQRSCPNTIAK
jgi:hypothetical protein